MTALDSVLLPDGTRLVHIGPHKTGTSALQGAFNLARRAAAAQGVHYAGPNRQPSHAAHAIAAASDATGPKAPALRPWRRLLAEIEAARETRVLVSSEWFSDATTPGIRLLVSGLDPDRVHIGITLRPLPRLLSSQWQQLAQARNVPAYEPWLQATFREPDGPLGKPFWHRHRHDRLVERWAEVVGKDRVTVVVADDRDRAALLRAFESLTGLRSGTLIAPDDRQNRSMTAAEIEVVRQVIIETRDLDVDPAMRHDLALYGVAGYLKLRNPASHEPRIETPRWALDESAAIARAAIDGIRATGVRIVGDLESLAAGNGNAHDAPRPLGDGERAMLSAAAAMGMLRGLGLARSPVGRGTSKGWLDAFHGDGLGLPGEHAATSYAGVSTDRIVGVLASRVRGSLSAWRRRFGRRLPSRRKASSVHSPAEVEYRSRG